MFWQLLGDGGVFGLDSGGVGVGSTRLVSCLWLLSSALFGSRLKLFF